MDYNLVLGENGAPSVNKLQSLLLEIFSKDLTRGSMPNLSLFDKESSEDIINAVALVFYARSIKNGAGERDIFYLLFGDMLLKISTIMLETLPFVPNPQTGGSWNDFNRLVSYLTKTHPRKSDILPFMDELIKKISHLWAEQLYADFNSLKEEIPKISLAAKYAPSEGTHFWPTIGIHVSRRLSELMNIKSSIRANYRRTLSQLRRHLEIIEVQMCGQKWSEINFSRVPSVAMSIYGRKAFLNLTIKDNQVRSSLQDRIDCANNFLAYKERVKEGVDKIHGGALGLHQYGALFERTICEDDLLELQFKDLLQTLRKNITGKVDTSHLIPVVDVSGSMDCIIAPGVSAKSIAIQMGMILSQLDESSPFAQRVITFDFIPQWVDLSTCPTNLLKYKTINNSEWGASTDFEATFNLILQMAIEKELTPEELNKYTLIVLSDMQFNEAEHRPWNTLHENMTLRFAAKGYRIPGMIYWNLASRYTNGFVVDDSTVGVTMVSGFGVGQLAAMLAGDLRSSTPYDKMIEVLSAPVFKSLRQTVLKCLLEQN